MITSYDILVFLRKTKEIGMYGFVANDKLSDMQLLLSSKIIGKNV